MPTRRYGNDEVREILALATTGDSHDRSLPAETDGLTLEQLEEIAGEAGIEPGRIAQAAARLDSRGQMAPIRRSFGMPVGVSRVVELPRAPTDREWEQLVSGFRSTFGVPGQLSTPGSFREWSHGNLHIAVEPTATGHQLRLATVKGDAASLNALGMVMAGMSVLMGAVVAASGKADKALVIVGMFGGMALAAWGANLVRLPRWARARQRQMESVAAQAVKLLSDS